MVDNNGNSDPPVASDDGGGEGGEQHDKNELSLEQALLAPLNSILKAQLHSARSFLNLLLQLGYPQSDGNIEGQRDGEPFHMEFNHYDEEGNKQTLRVPALSLVPIAPLAVDTANFELEMAVKKVSSMQQMQASRQAQIKRQEGVKDPDARPWFLVDKPVTIEGSIAPPTTVGGQQRNESQSSIKIKINVKAIPMPSGLDKLLTAMTNMGEVLSDDNGPDDDSGNTSSGETNTASGSNIDQPNPETE